MKLISIPKEKYDEYKLNEMFNCYKWDPFFYDNNTLAKYVLVLSKDEDNELRKLTENLDKETRESEDFLNKNLDYTKLLYLPKKISNELKQMSNYDSKKHIRLMRYDFHPISDGKWAVSEVNSDVPGRFC